MCDFHGPLNFTAPSLPQIGQFFGEVDPVLMINLVNTSLYSFNKTYDYQSVCDPEKDSKAAAGPRSVYVVRRGAVVTLRAPGSHWDLVHTRRYAAVDESCCPAGVYSDLDNFLCTFTNKIEFTSSILTSQQTLSASSLALPVCL